jgi:ABC-2 type transport system ATP-binding protein
MTGHSILAVDASTPVIEATDVVKRFGATTALDGATFSVGRGITGLLGANGAGKTTLLGLTLGLQSPDEGKLRILGLDPAHAGTEVRARVGYSPEHHNLPPDTSAHDLVRHLAEVHGLPHRAATARASDALWQVGLGEERFRPLGTMSTGQRQRVKLAQAIAHDPALVLLDEPTDGLDPMQRDEMLALIRRVGTEYGIDVVLSSHLLEEVERVCDSAVILSRGRVVAAGTLTELTGEGRGLLVEVDQDPTVLVEMLRLRGAEVESDGRRLVVRFAGDGAGRSPEELSDLVRDSVVALDIGVRRLTNRTVRLEDVFLEVGA